MKKAAGLIVFACTALFSLLFVQSAGAVQANIGFGCNPCPGAKYVCADAGGVCWGSRKKTVGCSLNDCDGDKDESYAIVLGYASPAQIDSGYGNIDIDIVDNKIQVVFHRSLEFPGGQTTMPIHFDYELGPSVSSALGHPNLTVRRGVYPIDYSGSPYGEVLLDIATVIPQVPVMSQWGVLLVTILLVGSGGALVWRTTTRRPRWNAG